jgi:hypothetical protein
LRGSGEFFSDFGRSLRQGVKRRPWRFVYVMALICIIWTTLLVGLWFGKQPKLSWMILAGLGGMFALTLFLRKFQELRRDAEAEAARSRMASQIAQFIVILVGNTAVVAYQARDYIWTSEDWLAFRAALALLTAFFLLAPLRFIVWRFYRARSRARRLVNVTPSRKWSWLFALRWSEPWAMCCYTLILKVEPQFVDGFAGSQIAWWTALSFVLLSASRVHDAFVGWRQQPRSSNGQALLVSMSFDLVSLLVVAAYPIWKAVSYVAAYWLQ